jgi:DNA-binding GntR family transcriptional regulator
MYDPSSPLLRNPQAGDLPQPDAKSRFAEDRLLDAVIWCDVLPGETITEADTMDRFGLTRAAARAALMRLGYDGWATPVARLGWQILPVSGALIGQVLAARRVTEPGALAQATVSRADAEEVRRLGGVLRALQHRSGPGVRQATGGFVDAVDNILMAGIDPFTARHLRKLWHHTARLTRYLEDAEAGEIFQRDEVADLVRVVCDRDPDGIATARHSLIDAQERFFLRQMLKSDAALGPGSGLTRRDMSQTAAINGRPT